MEETQHIESDSSALKVSTGITLCNGRYELMKFLGKGGFGITYLGRHILLNKYVAIKEYFPKDNFRRESNGIQVSYSDKSVARRNIEKFLKEAKTMAELNHEGVVKVNDVFEENNTAYYVMDYIEGKSLAEQLPIAQEQALAYIKQAAEALQYVHTKGILHLDIKPANIMINQSGKAVLIDFGISKHYDSEGKGTSSSIQGYSSGYSPIEQMTPGGLKQFTPPTDIYALGATLYKIISGTTPPTSTDLADEETLSRPENMSREVFGFINKCMQQKRKDRPQTMSEVLGLIEALSGEKPKPKPKPKPTPKPEPKPEPKPKPKPDPNPNRRIIRIIAMVVLIIAVVVSVVMLVKDCSGGGTETATETLTETPIAETLSKQLQEAKAKQQAEEQARQKKLQQEEQARLQAERQKKQQEEQARLQAERQKKQQQEREANFKSYKSRGDFYFNEYFDTGDSQAKQKAKQNYAKALQYKEDVTIRKRYNSL
ncbi:MAG: protein kinase [Candidatus Onthomorpha sp.]|nr:protein kinase [Candidatus Onthomorpha sp.]